MGNTLLILPAILMFWLSGWYCTVYYWVKVSKNARYEIDTVVWMAVWAWLVILPFVAAYDCAYRAGNKR